MNSKKLESVSNLSPLKRYEYFIKHVADFEEVWGLRQQDGWATTSDNYGKVYLPFWPEKEFAEVCAKGEWKDYYAELIPLDEFIDDWLKGMDKDGVLASIFPNLSLDSVVIEAMNLYSHLKEELKQYE